MKTFLLLNGQNLNLLGKRETEIYGSKSLKEIEDECKEVFAKKDVDLVFFQSNICIFCSMWIIFCCF